LSHGLKEKISSTSMEVEEILPFNPWPLHLSGINKN
jgi:hypothetical protein